MYTTDNPKPVNHFIDLEEPNFTGVVKDKGGNIAYYLNGKYHREEDPAIIYKDETIEYYLNGELHRQDGPAIIYANGTKSYWLNDKELHISTDQELKDCLILRMLK